MDDSYIIPKFAIALAIALVLVGISRRIDKLNNTMEVYLRRNLYIQHEFTIQNPDAMKELLPELTPEQKAKKEMTLFGEVSASYPLGKKDSLDKRALSGPFILSESGKD